jgi:hypothetical protein
MPFGIDVYCFTTVTITMKLANEEQMDQPQQAQPNPLRQRAIADEDGKKISPRAEIGRARQDVSNLVRFVTVDGLGFVSQKSMDSMCHSWHCVERIILWFPWS